MKRMSRISEVQRAEYGDVEFVRISAKRVLATPKGIKMIEEKLGRPYNPEDPEVQRIFREVQEVI